MLPILLASDSNTDPWLNWFWYQMPPQQLSPFAKGVDATYYFIYYVCVFFFVAIMAAMTYFCIRYRRKHPGEMVDKNAPTHSSFLEAAWSIIPSILVVPMFYWGFTDFMDMRSMPDGAYNIGVTGQKWNWTFSYGNGKGIVGGKLENVDWHDKKSIIRDLPAMHVPVNTDIVLTMNSKDVLHSFYIPVFRTKQDVVPGRYTKLWFRADRTGQYDIFCTEYCGDKHSEMLAQLVVDTQEDFDKFYNRVTNLVILFPDPVKRGEYLFNTRGCSQCHSLDGSPKANGGPSFLGAWGTEVSFEDGTSAKMDENYIRESVVNPQAKIRKGFGKIMSVGLLSKDEEFEGIIAFIRDLNEKAKK
ncbi:cytochrome c oxidase subunit II [bacterium]|nr:cytochrome c oxidase subunit II [bacterium]